MRIDEDSEATLSISGDVGNIVLRPWRWDIERTIHNQESDHRLHDHEVLVNRIQALRDSLAHTFPIKVGPEWKSDVAVPGIIRADICDGPAFAERSQMTSEFHWVVLSSGTVKLLHGMISSLWSLPACKDALGIDRIDPMRAAILPDLCFWTGIDFLVLHEIGHIVRGHHLIEKLLPWSQKKQSRLIMEHEADLFAAEQLAWIFVNHQTFLDGLPRYFDEVEPHTLRVVGMLAAFLLFSGTALNERQSAEFYPPFDQRLYGLIDFVSSTADRVGGDKLGYFEMMDAREDAINALVPFLEAHPSAQILNESGTLSEVRKFNADKDGTFGSRLMRQCHELDLKMFSFQEKWKNARLRRARHNPWDANW